MYIITYSWQGETEIKTHTTWPKRTMAEISEMLAYILDTALQNDIEILEYEINENYHN